MTDSGSSARAEPASTAPTDWPVHDQHRPARGAARGGVRYAFANLGSDHTGILEAYALASRLGSLERSPS